MKNHYLCGGMLPPYRKLAQEMVFTMKKHQMVGCSHPTAELDRVIGSFRWWNTSTLQQTRHVRQVGWEYPTTKEEQVTNNIKSVKWNNPTSIQPQIINRTKFVGWEYPTIFPILSTLWRELSWSHYKLIIRLKDKNSRDGYIHMYQMVGCSHPTAELFLNMECLSIHDKRLKYA